MTGAELDQYILANYLKKSLTRMEAECRISHGGIRQYIQALGIEDRAAEREFQRKERRDRWRQEHLEYVEAIERMAPTHSWTEIAQVLGVKRSCVANYANKNGLKHTPETYEALHQKATKVILSAPWTEDRKQKLSRRMNGILTQERLRIRWGLPQKTKLKIEKIPTRIKSVRSLLRSYGYITFPDEPYTIYYDEQTNRCPAQHVMNGRQTEEYFAKRYSLTFKAADGYEDEIREAVV